MLGTPATAAGTDLGPIGTQHSGIPNGQRQDRFPQRATVQLLTRRSQSGYQRKRRMVWERSALCPSPPRRTTPRPTNAKKQAFVGTRIGGCWGPRPTPHHRNSAGCLGSRPTPHQPQQRRLLGTLSRDGDCTARIVSIAVPADSLQVPCLFGLAPVFMRVLCGGKNSLIISLINSLLIHC